jgi:hypothetical protein
MKVEHHAFVTSVRSSSVTSFLRWKLYLRKQNHRSTINCAIRSTLILPTRLGEEKNYCQFPRLFSWRPSWYWQVKYSHYRPMGPRGFWEVKASRFRDIGTWRWLVVSHTPSLHPRVSWYSRGWVDPGDMELSDTTEQIPSDATRDRSRDLWTSSVVP